MGNNSNEETHNGPQDIKQVNKDIEKQGDNPEPKEDAPIGKGELETQEVATQTATEPDTTDTDVTETGTTEHTPIEPGTTDSDVTNTGTTEHTPIEPGTTDPDVTNTGTTEHTPIEPGTTDPDVTNTGTTESTPIEPGTTDPDVTDIGTTEPTAIAQSTTAPSNSTTQDQIDYIYLIQFYQEKRLALQNEEYDKDISALKNEQALFEEIKKDVIQFACNFENDLYYVFTETIENHIYIERDINNKKIYITFPPDGNKEAINELLKKVADGIAQAQDVDNVPYVNFRQPRDLDFRIAYDAPTSIQSFLKRKLNSLVVNLKILDNTRKEFLNLFNSIFANEKIIYTPPDLLNTERFLEIIVQQDKTTEEKIIATELLFEATIGALKTNDQKLSEARKLVEKFNKNYVEMLNKTLFKLYNSLRDAENQFPQELKELSAAQQEDIGDWHKIYNELKKTLLDFMEKNLNIKPLGAKKGDQYQDELHHAVLESEPDAELQNNQLKEVFNDGFVRISEGKEKVLKLANVQVVSN